LWGKETAAKRDQGEGVQDPEWKKTKKKKKKKKKKSRMNIGGDYFLVTGTGNTLRQKKSEISPVCRRGCGKWETSLYFGLMVGGQLEKKKGKTRWESQSLEKQKKKSSLEGPGGD